MFKFSPFLLIVLLGCRSIGVSDVDGKNTTIDSTYSSNSLDSIYLPYKAEMDEEMNLILGYSDTDFVKYQPECHLGNLVADVVHQEGIEFMSKTKYFGPGLGPTMALLNFGGLRSTINKGEITKGDIFSLMPFDNLITVAVLQPSEVKGMLKSINDAGGQPIANARIRMNGLKQWLFFDEEEYQFDKPVYVITSDYLAGGGDKMDFFKDCEKKVSTGVLIRDAIIKYVVEKDTLFADDDLSRIHIIR